jgi:hypothetical protein
MKRKAVDKVVWHVKAFLEWGKAVLELFPALWRAAVVFAPLVLDWCDVCKRPRTILWIPINDHAVCDKLEDAENQGSFYVDDSPLPPL